MDTLKNKKIGAQAEIQACEFLKSKGLLLIEKNFLSTVGEIDLIMKDGNEIVFVEVRSRNHSNLSHVIESVDFNKQQRIIRAALLYFKIKKYNDNVNCRFDVIAIHQTKLEWIKNAFSADNF